MNGIKMSDCKFYVDENARTVVCVIPNTREMLMNFIRDNLFFPDINLYDAISFWDRKLTAKIDLPMSFMGKAVCAKEDEWNEETGRMIAYSRARDKCYKSFFRRANLFIQMVDRRLNEAISKFNDFGMKLEEKREALQTKIEERINKDAE